jgi:hypothetical protein
MTAIRRAMSPLAAIHDVVGRSSRRLCKKTLETLLSRIEKVLTLN